MGRHHSLPGYPLHTLLAPHRLRRDPPEARKPQPPTDDDAHSRQCAILAGTMSTAARDDAAGRVTIGA